MKTSEASVSKIRFRDVTRDSSIDFVPTNGSDTKLRTMLETLGTGVGVIDFDRDGLKDIYCVGGGKIPDKGTTVGVDCGLFRNHGSFNFQDVGFECGEISPEFFAHGCAIGDFDNDGFQDLVVSGYLGLCMFKNMGDGTFMEYPLVPQKTWTTSIGFGDFDGDSNLDLFVGNYIDWNWDNHQVCGGNDADGEPCSPRIFEGVVDTILFSDGKGGFETRENNGVNVPGKTLGSLIFDFDKDGFTDIYVANDTTKNLLYINDGNGRFEESSLSFGGDVDQRSLPNGSMGVDLCDFDQNGEFDIGVANYEKEDFALYQNRNGILNYFTKPVGLASVGQAYVGWGTVFADFDRDGDQDLVLSNGHLQYAPSSGSMAQLAFLMESVDNKFRNAGLKDEYFGKPHFGRGVAYSDFDADGDLDLVFSNLNEPVSLLSNETENDHRLIRFTLVGRKANRDATGTIVEFQTNKKKYFRQITGGASYLSHYDRAVFFGIPNDEQPVKVCIQWPGGVKQESTNISIETNNVVIQN